MAADLAETAKADGTTADGEFWYATAAKLLAPLFFAAARDRPLHGRCRAVGRHPGSQRGVLHPRAGGCGRSARCGARLVVPGRAHPQLGVHDGRDDPGALRRRGPASSTDVFEPLELLSGSHTLYLCAPAHDQRRLRGYFTALTQQVLSHAFTQATRTRQAPRSAARSSCSTRRRTSHPLPELDGLAATCASHGIQLVTVWQDLAQVRARYGARAPTVLNNHRAKVFLPGIADPDTLEYASRLIGDEEVTTPSITRDARGGRSTTSTTGPRRLLPPEELRCLRRGDAVLVYGTLPPARLRLRPWWDSVTTPGSSPCTSRWGRRAGARSATPATPSGRW